MRYRVDYPIVGRRRHDIVFTRARVVVDVRGCYWHLCPEHGTMPKANAEWWAVKLEHNRLRDADTEVRLTEAGWRLICVWEHERAPEAADRVEEIVGQRLSDLDRRD
jgi:DNA mismatch endonuclease (patch repair protein)